MTPCIEILGSYDCSTTGKSSKISPSYICNDTKNKYILTHKEKKIKVYTKRHNTFSIHSMYSNEINNNN